MFRHLIRTENNDHIITIIVSTCRFRRDWHFVASRQWVLTLFVVVVIVALFTVSLENSPVAFVQTSTQTHTNRNAHVTNESMMFVHAHLKPTNSLQNSQSSFKGYLNLVCRRLCNSWLFGTHSGTTFIYTTDKFTYYPFLLCSTLLGR